MWSSIKKKFGVGARKRVDGMTFWSSGIDTSNVVSCAFDSMLFPRWRSMRGGGYTLNSRRVSVSIESWNILPLLFFSLAPPAITLPLCTRFGGYYYYYVQILLLFDIEKRKKFPKSLSENDVSFLVCSASLLSRHLGPEWRHRFNNPRRAEQPANYSREIEESKERRRSPKERKEKNNVT